MTKPEIEAIQDYLLEDISGNEAMSYQNKVKQRYLLEKLQKEIFGKSKSSKRKNR